MKFGEWILFNLGVYQLGYKIDKIEEAFELETLDTPEEMTQIIKECTQGDRFNLGQRIMITQFHGVIQKAIEKYGAKEYDFTYQVDTADGFLMCKGSEVKDWDDIRKIYE